MKLGVLTIARLPTFIGLLMAFGQAVIAQTAPPENLTELRAAILRTAFQAKGLVGVSVIHLEDHDTLSINGSLPFVMQSVVKLPIAVTVLHQIDLGENRLDEEVFVRKKDLPVTYSPLRDQHPEGNIYRSIRTLLSYMVSQSDNDACDILLDKITSKVRVEKYLHQSGIRGFHIRANEREMGADWSVQYKNWAYPVDLARLLQGFWNDSSLSKQSHTVLWKMLLETGTGAKRIKGLLNKSTRVYHKTGSSATNQMGLTPATNDIGLITLPNGKHIALVVMIQDSRADEITRDGVIAQISRYVYEFFASKK